MTIYLIITVSDDADVNVVAYGDEIAAFNAACEIACRCNDIVDLDLFRSMAESEYGMMMVADDDDGHMSVSTIDMYIRKVDIKTEFAKTDVDATFGEGEEE